jgi:hypothetical protein
MMEIEKKAGAVLGVVAYMVAVGAGLACGVPPGVVLIRAALAAIGGYVAGRLLGHVVLQAFLDDLAEARSREGESKEEPQA